MLTARVKETESKADKDCREELGYPSPPPCFYPPLSLPPLYLAVVDEEASRA